MHLQGAECDGFVHRYYLNHLNAGVNPPLGYGVHTHPHPIVFLYLLEGAEKEVSTSQIFCEVWRDKTNCYVELFMNCHLILKRMNQPVILKD